MEMHTCPREAPTVTESCLPVCEVEINSTQFVLGANSLW
jgi:hypothetical protein